MESTEAGAAVDVVCVGETMAQIVPTDGHGVVDAQEFALRQGGAESNVAIGLARLGHRVAWVSRLGDDAIGERVHASIAGEGVDVQIVRAGPGHPTGLFVKNPAGLDRSVTYYRRGSAASTMDRSDIDRALALKPRMLHVSGITPALSDGCADAIAYAMSAAATAGVQTIFDVNYRHALWSRAEDAAATLQPLAAQASIVLVGLDEAEELWHTHTVDEVRALLPNVPTLIVKDGDRQAVSFTGASTSAVPSLRFEVIESVGAGDAFAAGWLSGHLLGRSDETSLRFGHLMARAALTSWDDHGTALSPDELDEHATTDALWSLQ